MDNAEYKSIRKSLGTQAEVADMLGVTTMTIKRREKRGGLLTREAILSIRWIKRVAIAASKAEQQSNQ